MSLILDALNKADNERNKNTTPSLASNHGTETLPYKTRQRNTVIYTLCFIMALMLATVTYLLYDKLTAQKSNHGQPPAVEQNTNQVQNRANTLSTHERPAKQIAPSAQKASGAQIQTESANVKIKKYEEVKKKFIDAQYRQAESSGRPKTLPANTVQTAENRVSTGPKTDVASIYSQTTAPKKTSATQAPTKSVITAAPKKTKQANSLADYPNLGFMRDLPITLQKKIPTMMYTDHNFYGARPSVTINNINKFKGQKISLNLTLEEILKDGIILRYNDQKFKIAALNSWVNM